MLDIAIRGGQVIDGTGSPRRSADVGVSRGRVVALGEVDDTAADTIDASGMIVSPGFIDVHTHLDVQGFWDTTLSPSPFHGVTTVLGGNCGFSVAPLTEDASGYLMRMLARVEGMPLASLETGVPWNWRTTAEYLDLLEGRLAVNAGFMVGHSTIRRVVMGEAATEREATEDEIQAMKTLLHDGLAAGGLGFSSTRAQSHNDDDGRPVPSRHASDTELLELAALCGEYAGTSLEYIPHIGPVFPEPAVELMAKLSSTAQRPLNWNILVPTASNADSCEQKLTASDHTRALGGKVIGLLMPARFSVRLNFLGGFGLDMIPGWGPMIALRPAEKLRMLRDRAQRQRLADLARRAPQRRGEWEGRRIVETFTFATKRYEGRMVAEIAAEEGKEPFDALLDIVCADELRTTFEIPQTDTRADWVARGRFLRDRRTLVGASDAGAHLDVLGTFNYPTYLLEHGVREQEIITTEEGVHLLTQAPAELYGLRGRGVLTEGAAADMVVFDEATVGTDPLRSSFDLPTGAPRLYAEATGVAHVIVNGEPIIDHGSFTEARPGAVLRSGRDTVTPALI